MVEVRFAKAFKRHVDCPDSDATGATVAEVLGAYFDRQPAARSYVLDESGAVRKHVAVFHNSDQLVDRVRLTDPVDDGDRIDVFQALSGG